MDKCKICADCAFNVGVGTCAEGFMPEGNTCQGYDKLTKYPQYITDWAIKAYDAYNAAVGGVNFKGEPLPTGAEFFADPAKEKQADGWRAAVASVQKSLMEQWQEDLKKKGYVWEAC